jgi:mRNA interferase MazF
MKERFVPEAGDLVWVNFTLGAGHEQAGHRPALVLSPGAYNRRTSRMICCALTTRIKGYPFEVVVGGAPAVAVLADQIKTLDWRARKVAKKGIVSAAELGEVRAKVRALLGL